MSKTGALICFKLCWIFF